MTKVISLYGGPGCGKSTTAAGLFYHMKLNSISAELVGEYVKKWAWYGRKPTDFDQVYISGKQIHSESLLYGKVDYIITDSPIWLGAFYEQHYAGSNVVEPSLHAYMAFAKGKDVKHMNFMLDRRKAYVPKGRYETEEEAKVVDSELRKFLNKRGIEFTTISEEPENAVEAILQCLDAK